MASLTHTTPRGPLADFVSSLWDYRAEPPAHAVERLLPSPFPSLIVNLRDNHLLLAGPSTRPTTIETAPQCQTMGLTFQPGAATLLSLPASEVLNADLPLDLLWKSEVAQLQERLHFAGTPGERLRIFETWMTRRLRDARPPDRVVAPALAYLERTEQRVSIDALAKRFGLTSRRLAQIFAREVGLSPKAYHRLHRFQCVLRSVHGRGEADWTEVALAAGYYDQAHFNHHFREYAGCTPSEYLAAQGPYWRHLPL